MADGKPNGCLSTERFTVTPPRSSTPRPRLINAFTVDNKFKFHPVQLELGSERLHGSGVFSNVYRGHVIKPIDQRVAIKKSWPRQAESDMRKDKEVQILFTMHHPNIIKLLYVFDQKPPCDGEGICRNKVTDFMETTVSDFNKKCLIDKRPIDKLRCKLIAYQLLAGVAYLHQQKVCHRDMKSQNLLYDSHTSLLKIADFGNAKRMEKLDIKSTPYQVTRFYRAPELCLGFDRYGLSIDVWACGCVIAEVIEGGQILFRGKNNLDQFLKIEMLLGTPSPAELQAMFPGHPPFNDTPKPSVGLRERVRSASPLALDLLRALLKYSPEARLPAAKALSNCYFDDLREPGTQLENGMPLPVSIVAGCQAHLTSWNRDTDDDQTSETATINSELVNK